MRRILRPLFSADVLGLLLVLVALQALPFGAAASLRTTDTKYFFWVCLLAALIALGLSQRKWNGVRASAVMIVLGLLGLWILGARLAAPLLDLGRALLSVATQLGPSVRSAIPIEMTPLREAWLVVAQASVALGLRVQAWMYGMGRNVAVDDPLVRSMAWILIMWLVSGWTGWFAARRNAVAALVPSILLLAAITSYSEYRVETLWLMVLVLLLLMALWNYRNHTAQWESRRVDYSDSIGYDMAQAALFLTFAVTMIAFITPSLSWRAIRDFLRASDSQNQVAQVLGVQQPTVPASHAPAIKPSLPREHLLSGGFAQSEKIVMIVRTGELPPAPGSSFAAQAPRYYWRSITYDTYAGAGWITSYAAPQKFTANTLVIPGLLKGYRAVHLDVDLVEPEGKLFWSGLLFSADVPFTANWRLRPQSGLFEDQSSLLQADMFAALSQAPAYKADVYVPSVTEAELRLASAEYPEYIRQHYLQLPASMPDRVRELARQLTGGRTNAYDKAQAIEAYLRTYPYDLQVPAPPPDRDVADYFLFDLKRGYCDYYATAMVVLARLGGVPARFVSGYSPGSYDAANARYIVRELNAHSWAEVYFPDIGWIEFEPTAAQPEIARLPLTSESASAQAGDSAASRLLNRFRLVRAIYWLAPPGIVLLAVLLYFTLIERWLYLRLAPAAAIEKIYRRLYRFGRPLAGEGARAETAYEFKQKLVGSLDAVGKGSALERLLSGSQDDVESLTAIYQVTLFGRQPLQGDDVRRALSTWKRLRLRLLLARLSAFLEHFIRRRGVVRRTVPS